MPTPAEAHARQADGKLVVAGLAGLVRDIDFIVSRFNNDLFDLCIQDESNGNLLQLNATTGAYQFTSCSGTGLGGVGTLTKRGSLITLQHNAPDRRLTATIDTTAKRATASVQLLLPARMFSITDKDTGNNTCACQ